MSRPRPPQPDPAPLPEPPLSPAELRLIDCQDATTEALNLLAVVNDVIEANGLIDGELLSGLCDIVGYVITAVGKANEAVETARKMIRGEAP